MVRTQGSREQSAGTAGGTGAEISELKYRHRAERTTGNCRNL